MSHSLPIDVRLICKAVFPLIAVAGVMLFDTGPASASCWNKAICQAICSKDCCDATNLTAPANPEGLSKISLKALKAELGRAKSGTSFQKMLKSEVSHR